MDTLRFVSIAQLINSDYKLWKLPGLICRISMTSNSCYMPVFGNREILALRTLIRLEIHQTFYHPE